MRETTTSGVEEDVSPCLEFLACDEDPAAVGGKLVEGSTGVELAEEGATAEGVSLLRED